MLPCNFCHPGLSFAFVGSLAEGIVSGKITAAENHEQEKGHRRGQIRGELDESQVSVFFSSFFEPRNPIFGVSLFLGWGGVGGKCANEVNRYCLQTILIGKLQTLSIGYNFYEFDIFQCLVSEISSAKYVLAVSYHYFILLTKYKSPDDYFPIP